MMCKNRKILILRLLQKHFAHPKLWKLKRIAIDEISAIGAKSFGVKGRDSSGKQFVFDEK